MFSLFSKRDDSDLKERIIELEKMLRAQASTIHCIESQVLGLIRKVNKLEETEFKKRARESKNERDKDSK